MFFGVRTAAIPWRCNIALVFVLTQRMNSARGSGGRTILPRGTEKLVCLMLALIAGGMAAGAGAQSASGTAAGAPSLPNAPGTPVAAASQNQPSQGDSGTISGTVIDVTGAELVGAQVTLAGKTDQTALTNANGEFTFSGLPAGAFSLRVSAPGMKAVMIRSIVLPPGGIRFLPPLVLAITAASTSVQVFAEPETLAEQQLQLEMHQRVLGFLPNYYSVYNWHAVHLWPKQKFELAYRSEVDPVTFAIIGAEAGIEQYYNRYPSYGQEAGGYFKRFGSDYATDFIGTMIADAALPSLFHQDPRYFYKGKGSFGSRALYAVSQTLICRGDNGREQFDYSRVLGDFAAGGISNLYYPAADRGVSLVFVNGAVDLAANASTNLIREFILPSLSSNAHGQNRRKRKIPLLHF